MYYDVLVQLKNAQMAGKETFQMPFSKFDYAVARFLAAHGFASSAEKRAVGKRSVIEVKVKYADARPGMTDFRLISKPSRRIYAGYRELRPVRQGHGLSALSTPEGILSNVEARKKKLGGEHLFNIW
jgi:small subunit ribosomal protein S8